jgi:hypothetical protein
MKKFTLSITEFKAKCLRLLASAMPKPIRGSWKNVFQANGDIGHFDVADDWESNR